MFSFTQRKLAASAAAVVLAAGGATVAANALADDTAADDGPDVTNSLSIAEGNALTEGPRPEEANKVFIAPPAAAPAYSALAKSKQRPPGRVQYVAKVLASRFPDLNAASTKGLAAGDGTQAWVVSGSSHVCLGADNSDGTGYTCATNVEAARGAVSLVEEAKDGGLRSIMLVPDNVSAVSAAGARTAPSNNLVVTEYEPEDTVKAVFNDGRAAVSLQ